MVLTSTIYGINLSDFPLNLTVPSVVTTIGNEVICAVNFNTLSCILVKKVSKIVQEQTKYFYVLYILDDYLQLLVHLWIDRILKF